MVSALFRLLVALWPLWLWLLVRYEAAKWAAGTSYAEAAIAAAPLMLFGIAAAIFVSSRRPQKWVWMAAAGSCYAGYLDASAQYAALPPYLTNSPIQGVIAFVRYGDTLRVAVDFLDFMAPVFAWWICQGDGVAWIKGFQGGYRQSTSGAYGTARWMGVEEAKQLLGNGPLVIGEAYEPARAPQQAGMAPLLRYRADQGHLVTVAGTRSGKTVSVAIPNCVFWDKSLVVHDPKGELAQLCGPVRRRMGRDVLVLDPSREDSDSLNVLDWLDPTNDRVIETSRAVVEWLAGEAAKDDANASFKGNAKSLVQVAILEVVCRPDIQAKHLGTVREMLTNPNLAGILGAIAKREPSFSFGAAQQLAGELLGIQKNAAETWGGILFEASQMTSWLTVPTLARLVCGTARGRTVPTRALLGGTLNVFISVPLATLESTPSVARVILGALLNTIYEDYRQRARAVVRTLFLLDEMPRLGYMGLLKTARDAGAGMGVTLWAIIQDLGQLEEQYGEEGMQGWLESCQIKSFFGVNTQKTAELVSNMLGEMTIEIENKGSSAGSSSGGFGQLGGGRNASDNYNQQYLARKLLTPAEVMRLGVDAEGVPDEQLVFVRGRAPLRCGMAKWYRRPDLKAMIEGVPVAAE